MSKFEIDLPPALSEFLQRQVDAGLFNNAADAIQDAVRRAFEDDGGQLDAVRAALAPGLADAEAGRFFEGSIDDILAEAKAAHAQRR